MVLFSNVAHVHRWEVAGRWIKETVWVLTDLDSQVLSL